MKTKHTLQETRKKFCCDLFTNFISLIRIIQCHCLKIDYFVWLRIHRIAHLQKNFFFLKKNFLPLAFQRLHSTMSFYFVFLLFVCFSTGSPDDNDFTFPSTSAATTTAPTEVAVAAMEKVVKTLAEQKYDPLIRPPPPANVPAGIQPPTTVTIQMSIFKVSDVDEKSQTFSLVSGGTIVFLSSKSVFAHWRCTAGCFSARSLDRHTIGRRFVYGLGTRGAGLGHFVFAN